MFTTVRLLILNALAVVVVVILGSALLGIHEPAPGVLHAAIGAFFLFAWIIRADDLIASKVQLQPIILVVVGISFLLFLFAMINDVAEFADVDFIATIVVRAVFLLVFLAILAHGVAAFIIHLRGDHSIRDEQ